MRKWLPAVLYTVQDQSLLVTAKIWYWNQYPQRRSRPLANTLARRYIGPPVLTISLPSAATFAVS